MEPVKGPERRKDEELKKPNILTNQTCTVQSVKVKYTLFLYNSVDISCQRIVGRSSASPINSHVAVLARL